MKENIVGLVQGEGKPAMSATNLSEIIPLVEKLSTEEKLQLIEHVAHELRETKAGQVRHWRDFRGLGKEIWQGIDTQAYIDKLRDE
jgi:hypothetical protein